MRMSAKHFWSQILFVLAHKHTDDVKTNRHGLNVQLIVSNLGVPPNNKNDEN